MGSVRRGSWKAYLPYLGLNVIVSAITVLLVLAIWNGSSNSSKGTPTPTVDVVSQVDEYIPTETPTKIPSPTPVTYIVRGGDTMLGIATEFGVSIDALMIANRLQDPNSLTAGQLLVIPIGEDIPLDEEGVSQATSTPRSTEEPENVEPSQQAVIINGVETAGVVEGESVRLLNQGGEVSMAGWVLEDEDGHRFLFPAFTFYSTGAVDVHTRAGTNTSIDLYWGLDEAIWNTGVTIILRDASGQVQSTFTIP